MKCPLIFYRNDENKTLAAVDGNNECIVDTDFVDKILAQIEKIPTEEPVEILEQEEE